MDNHVNTSIKDAFWSPILDRMCDEIIPYQYDVLNDAIPGISKSNAIENFRIAAGISKGKFEGMIFQDSDVAKWIEAASFSLKHHNNKRTIEEIEGLISLFEKAQLEDGYLDTYFINEGIKKRFTDISFGHEMYCAGHMIEAAVAYA